MSTIRPDIKLIRGDTSSIDFSMPGVDFTGAYIFFTAKPALTDDPTDSTAVIEVEVSSFDDPTSGRAVIPLSSSDTDVTPGDYYYDIQVKKADGSILSIPARKLTVVADVTRRTS